MNIIHGAPMHLPDNTYVAIDTEFQKMNIKKMHRAHGQFALMTMCYEPETVYYIDNTDDIQYALQGLDNCVWLMHNAKFDITQLRPYANIPPRKKLVDTMLMEKILWSGWYEHFDLQSCVRRYLDRHLDKSLQSAWEDAEVSTPEMLEYACEDAKATLEVWYEQKKHITKSDMQVYQTVDLPALWSVLDFAGFRVDREKWLELSVTHRKLSDEIDETLPVNPRSPKQVVNYLRQNGFKKIKSSAEGDIAEAIKKFPNAPCIPVAQKILDSRGYRKLASTYGASMIEDYAETDELGQTIIYGDFNILGAATGRMSCSSPNLQNIPTRETQVFRECFIPKQGNKLVIGDYSQQEIFIMAFLSQDDNMIEICNSGRDIYIEMAKLMYKKDIDKKDPLRKKMKSIVLGTDYGMSKYGLSKRLDCTVDEAEGLINDFFHTFPKVKRWMDGQEQLKKYTQTVLGRRTWLNPYNDKSQRNAYNNPIQGCISSDNIVMTEECGMTTIRRLYDRVDENPIHIWDGNKFVLAHVAFSGYKPAHRITLYGNNTIWCSKEHRFWTSNTNSTSSWKTTEDFSIQTYLNPTNEVSDWNCSYVFPFYNKAQAHNAHHYSLEPLWKDNKFDFGLLIGRLSTDGGIYRNRSVTLFVAQHEISILPKFESLFASIGEYRKDNQAEYKNRHLEQEKYLPLYRLVMESKELANQIDALKIVNQIPEVIKSNKDAMRGYLQSIFDADGTITDDNITLVMGKGVSKQIWAKEIQQALFLFGITSRVIFMDARTHVSIQKDHCSLFASRIGFINPTKQEKAEKIISKETHKIYGRAIRVKDVYKSIGLPIPMYDIVNSATGQFCANGIITHNSAADMMKKCIGKIHDHMTPSIVAVIHDECILDVPESVALITKKFLEDIMVETANEMLVGMRCRADVLISDTWRKE
jgi:DNA polymerase I-like protein with 3'-5' exonuclease and polymerase domains